MPEYQPYDAPPGRLAPRGKTLTSMLLVIYVAIYLIEQFYIDDRVSRTQFVYGTFALSLGGLKQGYLWQLLTYQFMHGSDLHLIVNCLALYFIGPTVELLLGRARFVIVYFGGGLLGGLVQLVSVNWLGGQDVAMVGASGGLMALLGVVAYHFWNQRLRLLIFFVLPVSLTGRSMLIVLTIIDLGGALMPRSHIAHFAHLGGLYSGFLASRYLVRRFGYR
jgi:rhomboid family protein